MNKLKTYADIAARARELHSAGALPTREWTLPMICDHLAKAMIGSTGALGPSPAHKPLPLMQRMVGQILLFQLGFIPSGRKSPERVLPRQDVKWEDAIGSLEEAIARCQEKMGTDEPWMPHPLLGFSDGRRWERFHIVHAKHHFGCLSMPGL